MSVAFSHQTRALASVSPETVLRRFETAHRKRRAWEDLWQDCYDYALPQRGDFLGGVQAGNRRSERLYDATALDAVDQLAASLLGNLTPPLVPWFGFRAGPELNETEAERIAPLLEKAARIMHSHFDQSNFIVEVHQAFLDLVVGGTASLAFEESHPGTPSAFRFTAVPLGEVILEEGDLGFLDGVYRILSLTLSQIKDRYPAAEVPHEIEDQGSRDVRADFRILEAVLPNGRGFDYTVIALDGTEVLLSQTIPQSPFINFRWMKSAGESYGRSPIMKALPDIKTANKVVELILKNASIAVTGIWQAEDDGVLNPANIELVPGAIIPKAMGSKGLTPLEMPGRFDVSQIILDDLRSRIRHALLADRLPELGQTRMTATEVTERSAQMSLLLGATYGRLQSEFLIPLIQRAYLILKRRGVLPDLPLDGRIVQIELRSPLARAEAARHLDSTMTWVRNILSLGNGGAEYVNIGEVVRYMSRVLGVPPQLLNSIPSPEFSLNLHSNPDPLAKETSHD